MTTDPNKTLRKDPVVDNFHGTRVPDPYRWLEDAESPETVAWVDEQNSNTKLFLAKYRFSSQIADRLNKLQNYPRQFLPHFKAGYFYYWKNEGLQNQPVFYRTADLETPATVVLDPNSMSEDGTIAVINTKLSHDGHKLVFGISRNGSDWEELIIRDLDTGQDYDEVIQWCRYTGIAWDRDSQGFYYSRYPDPTTVPPAERNNFNRVFYHRTGSPQAQDALIYECPENKELLFAPIIKSDCPYLFLHVSHGTDTRNRFYYRPLESAGPFIKLLDDNDAAYDFIDVIDTVCYFRTDLGSPRGRIIAIDLKNPGRENFHEIIPESEDVMTFAKIIHDLLVVVFTHDAYNKLRIYSLDGVYQTEIEMPTLGAIIEVSGEKKDSDMFFSFTSFLYPMTIFKVDLTTFERSLFYQPPRLFEPDEYETCQIFYPSTDGTPIPMFLTFKKGISLNGMNPVLLTGYGGFNVSMPPYYSAFNFLWIESGGIFAMANLRGGGEYGEEWHQAGMLEKKQTVFNDFISAAEWLIERNYTNNSLLAISGGSNGGLLVAACMVQRPDLYGAVICEVPVLDMLRYHKFSIGYYWMSEYGNPEDPAHFPFMYAYSPLHNVAEGVTYPPLFVLTADTDDRVVSSHAKKFVATIQEKSSGDNPLLLYVETKAGHGMGKPVSKVVQEFTAKYSFLFSLFQMKPKMSVQ